MKRYLEAQPQPGRDDLWHRPAPAGSGWTTGRIIALAAGSVLLLISLAFIAGGGTLVWADTEQVHSGYVTTSYRHVLHTGDTPWPATRSTCTA